MARRLAWGLAALAGAGLALALAFLCLDAAFPIPMGRLAPPAATVVAARNGQPLRLFLAADGAWRFPVKLADVSPVLPEIVLAAEDRHFYAHPGVNPLSLARAALSNLKAGRVVSGGSTVTMQLARLAEPKERTLAAKAREAFRALQIERHLSKTAILERYLNLAPYGGNIVGVGAASAMYFGKTPDRLSLAEAALLTVLPRSPLALDPARHPEAAKAARDRLLDALAATGHADPRQAEEAKATPVPRALFPLPFAAPHLAELAYAQAGPRSRIDTTLDPAVHKAALALVRSRADWLKAQGINHAAAVVLDVKTRDVLALVGSTNYFGDERFGRINGALIRRSPGSALKPFLYALAFDQGAIVPQSFLLDIPTGFAGYAPKNYDGLFRGRVTAEQALIASLNVPAVRLLDTVGVSPFLGLLHRAGLATLDKPAAHYGLSLVLGGGEVTLLSLVNAYADLAEGGLHRPPRLLAGPEPAPMRLLTPEACALVTDILSRIERPDLPASWDRALAVPAVAWKTGTSFGHRDAWAVGYSADHAIGVWVGNMDGTPVKGISGAVHAGPLLFELFRAVEDKGSRFPVPKGLDLAEIEVCADSRALPTPLCPRRVKATIIPGQSRLAPCPVHRQVLVDAETGLGLAGDCLLTRPAKPLTVAQYPAELVAWWRAVGIPFDIPPALAPDCAATTGVGPRIVSPSPLTPYKLRRDAPPEFQKIALTAEATAQTSQLTWYVDGLVVAQGPPSDRLFWEPAPGPHRLTVTDNLGRTDAVTVTVE